MVAITLPRLLYDRIEAQRGLVPRSRFITKALENALKEELRAPNFNEVEQEK